jgi:hypothetical protein
MFNINRRNKTKQKSLYSNKQASVSFILHIWIRPSGRSCSSWPVLSGPALDSKIPVRNGSSTLWPFPTNDNKLLVASTQIYYMVGRLAFFLKVRSRHLIASLIAIHIVMPRPAADMDMARNGRTYMIATPLLRIIINYYFTPHSTLRCSTEARNVAASSEEGDSIGNSGLS